MSMVNGVIIMMMMMSLKEKIVMIRMIRDQESPIEGKAPARF